MASEAKSGLRADEQSGDLRYPIGKFQRPETVSAQDREKWIADIEEAPAKIRAAVEGLLGEKLERPYRPGGWTVRQVIHHVPESHMNAYIRFKLALTEDEPTIKTYEESLWAQTADVKKTPPEISLGTLELLHKRWVILLRSMSEEQWARKFRHPELGLMRLDQNLALYAWHGKHHAAHVTALREREGW
jgi:DinB superfamily